MKNKKLIYYAIAAMAAIYYFSKIKKVAGIEQEAEQLSKKQTSKLKFGIDRETMEDLYREHQFKY